MPSLDSIPDQRLSQMSSLDGVIPFPPAVDEVKTNFTELANAARHLSASRGEDNRRQVESLQGFVDSLNQLIQCVVARRLLSFELVGRYHQMDLRPIKGSLLYEQQRRPQVLPFFIQAAYALRQTKSERNIQGVVQEALYGGVAATGNGRAVDDVCFPSDVLGGVRDESKHDGVEGYLGNTSLRYQSKRLLEATERLAIHALSECETDAMWSLQDFHREYWRFVTSLAKVALVFQRVGQLSNYQQMFPKTEAACGA